MQIDRLPHVDHLELKLEGRLDATWSDHVSCALADCVRSGQHRIALDLAAVDYLSSAGLRILVLHARQLQSIDGALSVTRASPMVRKILELAGLEHLLREPARTAPAGSSQPGPVPVCLPGPGAMAEVFVLDATTTPRLHRPGNPAPWLAGCGQPATASTVHFPDPVFGIGLGALGDDEPAGGRGFGELLAAAGAAVCQPADGSSQPDYLIRQAALIPTARMAYGLLGDGPFNRLLRFDKGLQQPHLPFSTLVRACLDLHPGSAIGLVMVAETACLVGASLRRLPSAVPAAGLVPPLFRFPEVREYLSLTTEPAFLNSTSLVVGFAAGPAAAPALRLLKPLEPGGEVYGHFHAAAFPYQPLRQGPIELVGTVGRLFESGQVLGVLHLLNDWRPFAGAGESAFLRGACWSAPVTLEDSSALPDPTIPGRIRPGSNPT